MADRKCHSARRHLPRRSRHRSERLRGVAFKHGAAARCRPRRSRHRERFRGVTFRHVAEGRCRPRRSRHRERLRDAASNTLRQRAAARVARAIASACATQVKTRCGTALPPASRAPSFSRFFFLRPEASCLSLYCLPCATSSRTRRTTAGGSAASSSKRCAYALREMLVRIYYCSHFRSSSSG